MAIVKDDAEHKVPCMPQQIVRIDLSDVLSRSGDQSVASKIGVSSPKYDSFACDRGKRRFDIIMSLLILLITSPVMLLTLILIWLSTFGRAPVIYRQTRVGMNGRLFSVIKFRSMRTDAEQNGARMAIRNDARVTRIGRFIRKTRIDELPQLFNVLKGEMSLVGPRPERPEFVSLFQRSIKGYSLRLQVKPGITGWAQVCGFRGETDIPEKMQARVEHDIYYIENWSVFFDLQILVMTLFVGFVHKNAY